MSILCGIKCRRDESSIGPLDDLDENTTKNTPVEEVDMSMGFVINGGQFQESSETVADTKEGKSPFQR